MTARGWDFFVMDLAYALHMTRRQLLAWVDSRELTAWMAYSQEINRPRGKKKQSKEEIEGAIKSFMAVKSKGKKVNA